MSLISGIEQYIVIGYNPLLNFKNYCMTEASIVCKPVPRDVVLDIVRPSDGIGDPDRKHNVPSTLFRRLTDLEGIVEIPMQKSEALEVSPNVLLFQTAAAQVKVYVSELEIFEGHRETGVVCIYEATEGPQMSPVTYTDNANYASLNAKVGIFIGKEAGNVGYVSYVLETAPDNSGVASELLLVRPLNGSSDARGMIANEMMRTIRYGNASQGDISYT